MAACGQSYEETKQLTKKQRMEAARKDSAALKVAVMPTLDCLPLYVAQHYNLYDTLRGGVRLKYYKAQMDCDTAMERGGQCEWPNGARRCAMLLPRMPTGNW